MQVTLVESSDIPTIGVGEGSWPTMKSTIGTIGLKESDFLKLHYMLTKRPEEYWRANTQADTIPESLQEDLALWQYRVPSTPDFTSAIEQFPAASYRYVIYGMDFRPELSKTQNIFAQTDQTQKIIARNQQFT